MFAQRHPRKLVSFLDALHYHRHARWQDLAVADYSRPPSEAYLRKRDVVLKPCQTISPGFTKGKAPLDILCYRRCYTSKGRPQCRNRHHQTPCLGNTGKTNLLKIHHHKNLPKCEALGSPNTNKQVKNSTWERSPCKDGWNDRLSHCKEIYKNEGLAVEWKHLM